MFLTKLIFGTFLFLAASAGAAWDETVKLEKGETVWKKTVELTGTHDYRKAQVRLPGKNQILSWGQYNPRRLPVGTEVIIPDEMVRNTPQVLSGETLSSFCDRFQNADCKESIVKINPSLKIRGVPIADNVPIYGTIYIPRGFSLKIKAEIPPPPLSAPSPPIVRALTREPENKIELRWDLFWPILILALLLALLVVPLSRYRYRRIAGLSPPLWNWRRRTGIWRRRTDIP